jgi:hypothetical protein
MPSQFSPLSLPASETGWLRGLLDATERAATRLRVRIAGISPNGWFLILFAGLLLAFVVTLLTEPAAGRGGH